MLRHVYLILAHKNWSQLGKLTALLDDPRNDIILHIDKKSAISDAEKKAIAECARSSTVRFVEPISVMWGGHSMVWAELRLLETAVEKGYDYYHLLSGMDLPLKTQDEIHCFFELNQGREFIDFGNLKWTEGVSPRLKYYWFLQNRIGSPDRMTILRSIEKVSVLLQRIIGVNRIKGITFTGGSQWWSITDDFAQMICRQNESIMCRFKYTKCGDESLAQVMAVNSEFGKRVYESADGAAGNLRLIDWRRGSPYVFRICDYDRLMNSGYLFARKFDETTDAEIIDRIYQKLNVVKAPVQSSP